MSASTMINLAFDDFTRFARDSRGVRVEYPDEACEETPALRIALLYGEQLRVPSSSEKLQLLSGTAWVSLGGRDHILRGGDCLSLSREKGGAIISPLREEAILFEIS